MEEVLLLATCDGSTLPLLRSYAEQHLSNGIVPRLLGWPVEDGLTTPQPSRDDQGRYTLLQDLGVDKDDFLHLLQFFRTPDLNTSALRAARRAALQLGGVEALDAYRPPYNPSIPEEDTKHRYEWSVCLDSLVSSYIRENPGWEAARASSQMHYFYCRKLKS